LRGADLQVARVDVGELSPSYNPAFGVFNRLGIPSKDAPSWQAEYKAAAEGLAPGQRLVLSVAGSRAPDGTNEDLVNDFVCVVGLAVEAGARVVELNLSCPNSAASPLYKDLDLALVVCKAVAQSLSGTQTKILLKIGYMLGNELYNFVMSTADLCDGYTAINSIPVEGFQQGPYGQEPAFGQLGVRAGLSGAPILELGLHCARELAEIKVRRQLRNLLVCGGGVQDKESARRYLQHGADFVFLNSVFFMNPNAAIDIRRHLDRTWQEKESNALRTENALLEWSRAVAALLEGAAGSGHRHSAILTASNAELVEWYSRWERTTAGPQRIEHTATTDFFIERIRARLQDDTERA
jgi:dihydroorotate dehydrogenase